MKTALILCHGRPPLPELLHRHLATADLVIVTDGIVQWAWQVRVPIDVIVGDMDSRPPEWPWDRGPAVTEEQEPERRERRPPEIVDFGPHTQQEDSDAEKALRLALERGAERIVLLGATGRRLDHTLANVWLVAKYHQQAEIVLADEYGELRVVSAVLRLPTRPRETVSLVPLTPEVIVETEGLKWPLNGVLAAGTRGLSNEASSHEITIRVHSGLLAVITSVAR